MKTALLLLALSACAADAVPAPKVAPPEPTAHAKQSGLPTEVDVCAVVHGDPDVQACVRALGDTADAPEVLNIGLELDGQGRIRNLFIEPRELADSAFEACIEGVLAPKDLPAVAEPLYEIRCGVLVAEPRDDGPLLGRP